MQAPGQVTEQDKPVWGRVWKGGPNKRFISVMKNQENTEKKTNLDSLQVGLLAGIILCRMSKEKFCSWEGTWGPQKNEKANITINIQIPTSMSITITTEQVKWSDTGEQVAVFLSTIMRTCLSFSFFGIPGDEVHKCRQKWNTNIKELLAHPSEIWLIFFKKYFIYILNSKRQKKTSEQLNKQTYTNTLP